MATMNKPWLVVIYKEPLFLNSLSQNQLHPVQESKSGSSRFGKLATRRYLFLSRPSYVELKLIYNHNGITSNFSIESTSGLYNAMRISEQRFKCTQPHINDSTMQFAYLGIKRRSLELLFCKAGLPCFYPEIPCMR